MKRRNSNTPSNAESLESRGERSADGSKPLPGQDHERKQWAPLVLYLGPCFSEKKVSFGMPMEHICTRDTSTLYDIVTLESAIQVWMNSAHEGTLKEFRQKVLYGQSLLQRMLSEDCAELRLCTLYFSQKITKKELKEQISAIFNDEEILTAFAEALWRIKNEKIYCKLNSTIQIFIPEAQSSTSIAMKKKLKWALKYNPEIISYDEGNLIYQQYDVEEALLFAAKYGRKVRIARWSAEIPEVTLSDLIFKNLVHFLRTGRYVDCRQIAQSYSYAESRALNALQQETTAEDFAFDYGYVLDHEGYVSKCHGLHSATLTVAAPLQLPSSRWCCFFRASNKRYAAQHTSSAAHNNTAIKRRSTLRDPHSGVGTTGHTLIAEHAAMAKQLEQELGMSERTQEAAGRSSKSLQPVSSTVGAESVIDEQEATFLAALAARNAAKKRITTDWKAFLNHTPDPSGGVGNRPSNKSAVSMNSKSAGPLKRENSFSTSNSGEVSAKKSMFEMRHEAPRGNENGSYTYGLGKGGHAAGIAMMTTEVSTADVKASKASAKKGNAQAPAPAPRAMTALEETIAVKRISVQNLLTVVRSNATSLCEEDVELPQFPHEAKLTGIAARIAAAAGGGAAPGASVVPTGAVKTSAEVAAKTTEVQAGDAPQGARAVTTQTSSGPRSTAADQSAPGTLTATTDRSQTIKSSVGGSHASAHAPKVDQSGAVREAVQALLAASFDSSKSNSADSPRRNQALVPEAEVAGSAALAPALAPVPERAASAEEKEAVEDLPLHSMSSLSGSAKQTAVEKKARPHVQPLKLPANLRGTFDDLDQGGDEDGDYRGRTTSSDHHTGRSNYALPDDDHDSDAETVMLPSTRSSEPSARSQPTQASPQPAAIVAEVPPPVQNMPVANGAPEMKLAQPTVKEQGSAKAELNKWNALAAETNPTRPAAAANLTKLDIAVANARSATATSSHQFVPITAPPSRSNASETSESRAAARAAEKAAAAAEAEANRQKLAKLKAERHLREMKRMQTAVFHPPTATMRPEARSASAKEGPPAGNATPQVHRTQLETQVWDGPAQASGAVRTQLWATDGSSSSVKAKAAEINEKVQKSKQLLAKYSMPNLKLNNPTN